MNEYLSRKIKILSFIAIILVVLLHAYTVGDNDVIMCDISYNSFIQYLFSQGVTRIAVPLFFLISGYLFFRNIPNAKFSDFIKKYKSRFHTLFIPFMFWSILSLIFYILLSVIINIFIPSLHEFRSDIILIKIFQYIFITPIAFQLWFLRDLIVLVIVSPIIYILIKHLKVTIILLFFIIWFFAFLGRSMTSLLFFSIGSYFAVCKQNIIIKTNKYNIYSVLFLLIWIICLIIETYLVYISGGRTSKIINLFHNFNIIIGIFTIWNFYDFIEGRKISNKICINSLLPYTFFIYVFHEPLMTYIIKFIGKFVYENQLMSLIAYFLCPTITIIICIIIAKCLKKYTPKIYKTITGGR